MLKRNVLIFHQAALGDFILTWPLGLALGRLYPQSRVIYVTSQSKGQLAEKVLRLDWMDIDSGWSWLYTSGAEGSASALSALAGAHTIITTVAGADSPWVENARRASHQASILSIDPVPPPDWSEHASRWLLQQCQPLPAIQAAMQNLLRSVADRGVGYPYTPAADVVIHPGSGSMEKCWPADRYIELIGRLQALGMTVRVVLGEVELEQWPAAQINRFARQAEVRRPGSYLELMRELSTAGVFVGNDSGPAHLAGIIGIKTIALFGPTAPEVWRPLGPRVTTIYKDPLSALGVDDVVAAVCG